MTQVGPAGPYARAAPDYWRAGWTCPLPVKGKSRPVDGYTGYDGRNVSYPDLTSWTDGAEGSLNVALRMTSTIGIDVDAYGDKEGAETSTKAQADLGELPPTFTSTSRGPGQPSRIRLYRVPVNVSFKGAQTRLEKRYGPHVDVIHRGHRYAMVWPSVHPGNYPGDPQAGQVYRWYGLDDELFDDIPSLRDVPELPKPWLAFLAESESGATSPPTGSLAGHESSEQSEDPHRGPIPQGQRHDKLMRYASRLIEVAPRLGQHEYELLCWRRWKDCEQPPQATYEWTWQAALNNPVRDVWGRYEHGTVAEDVLEQRIAERVALREQDEYVTLVARERAKERRAAEQATEVDVQAPISLSDLLREPDEPTKWRIQDVWPSAGNVVLSAQYKAGKTTTINNLVRCLADGDRFLGIYPVEQVTAGTVGLTDFEMSRAKVRDWLRDQDIQNTDTVQVWPLRGQAATFDLLNVTIRTTWVERLKAAQVRVWIIDCLGPILSALGFSENENKEVGRLLDAIITTATEAGVDEVLLVHHMGHVAERSRGASRLRDWPDVEWRLVRQKNDDLLSEPDPNAPRFFSAFGRDVEVPEGQLIYTHNGRRLAYAEGNRKQARAAVGVVAVLSYVRNHPGANVRDVQKAAADSGTVTRDGARDALKAAVGQGYLLARLGPRGATLHSLTEAGAVYLADGGH